MSADPLLTTLCSVCRSQPPRYKCPQCITRYCSVPCNRRHRARTGCSGIRDVTKFVPKSKLCTESGIDRDYNFLQRIETARFSTHKHVVDERRVLRQNEVKARVQGEDEQQSTMQRGKYGNKRGGSHSAQHRKPQEPAALQKQWQGEELRYVPTRPRVPRLAEGDGSDAAAVCALAEPAAPTQYEAAASQRVRALCRRNGITLLGAPRGLARQRANSTTVATERGAAGKGGKQTAEVLLHWQVEWMLHDQKEMLNGSRPAPVLRQLLDNVPLFRAYVSLASWRRKQQSGTATARLVTEDIESSGAGGLDMDTREDGGEAPGAKAARRPSPVEGSPDGNSFFFAYDVQNQDSSAWHTIIADDDAGLDDAHLAAKYDLRYFLLRPRAPGAAPLPSAAGKGPVNELIPLSATDTLASALPGRSVLEFPTIYVLPAGTDDLPAGCVLGSTARKVVAEAATNGAKRPWEGGPSSAAKRRGPSAEQAAGDEDSETSSSGSDGSEDESEEEQQDEADEADEDDEVEDDNDDGALLDAPPAAVGIAGLPPLVASAAEDGAGNGKRKLVVYDSWSEGSDIE